MPALDFERPEGCQAEAHYSVAMNRRGGNNLDMEAVFQAVCAGRIGPFRETASTNSYNRDRYVRDRDGLVATCGTQLGRLIGPYCAQCANNPKNSSP